MARARGRRGEEGGRGVKKLGGGKENTERRRLSSWDPWLAGQDGVPNNKNSLVWLCELLKLEDATPVRRLMLMAKTPCIA